MAQETGTLYPTSKHDQEMYAYGACHHLAIAMVRMFPKDLQLLAVTQHASDQDYDNVIHVYAYDPKTDVAYDIFGERPYQDIHQEIDDRFICDIDGIDHCPNEEYLRDHYVDDADDCDRPLTECSEDDIKDAMQVIRKDIIPNMKTLPGVQKKAVKSTPGLQGP